MKKKKYFLLSIFIFIALVMFFLNNIANFVINIQWFSNLGYLSVYFTKLKAVLKLMIPLFLISFIFIYFYYKSLRKSFIKTNHIHEISSSRKKTEKIIFLVSNCAVSFILAYSTAMRYWSTILQFSNSKNFDVKDYIFNKDVSFYIFKLPLIQSILNTLIIFVIVLIVITFIFYGLFLVKDNISSIEFTDHKSKVKHLKGKLTNLAGRQLAVLFLIGLIFIALNFVLKTYYLVYSPRGIAFGASYTDVKVTLLFYRVIAIICLCMAIIVFLNVRKHNFKPVFISIALVVILLVAENLTSLGVQRFIVKANEMELEKPYLNYNIEMTRKGFNVENIESRDFDVKNDLTKNGLKDNKDIFENLKINSVSPTLSFYNQVQVIRYYYNFNDIDVDRYNINGNYNQVFIAPREINIDAIEPNTWINKHLKYTHGYGVVMNKVNSVSEQGQPNFIMKDIPVENNTNIEIENPRIYFGENTDYYAITNTKTDEFDAPKGGENQTNRYDGKDGVKLNFANKVLFALKEKDINILLSNDITSDSKLIMRRNIMERVESIAPFLKYDTDPYTVINNGKLYWIIDAYTTSNKYPFSEPYNGINYMRNSVKVIVDAYDGTTDFYVVDNTDPIIKCYEDIFNGLFKDVSEMPKGFKEHFKYPQEMFSLQSKVLEKYHMTDPYIFFNGEDLWQISKNGLNLTDSETKDDEQKNNEVPYVVTRLPGEDKTEMVMLNYFNMRSKQNMVSIFAAKMDGDDYGKLILYKFPPQKTIYSPMLFNNTIRQDDYISKEIKLWQSNNSDVILGETIIIPIQNSLLYIEPLYIVANNSSGIPEMKRVIMYNGNKVVIEENIEKAIESLFGASDKQPGKENANESQQSTPEDGSIENNEVKKAKDLFNKALEAQKSGDWSKYGEYINELGKILNNIN
ncbi:UPF0182 family protein [Clostridium frigidicarnis]|uniref:UPF0182 protein SAMN04488528_10734 n=1 Tax=Clostridium frigidicarnis TaxID=84698 RepID=A0A1I1B7C9_9CLOT|nr:UPF0182 family protein [Clostridium frigidicarnis]SFB46161.1 hypothetical protein SAMN04488528_10734 [Clostridium frigidicarnis]